MCIEDEYIRQSLRRRYASYSMVGAVNFNLEWGLNTRTMTYYATAAGRVQFRDAPLADLFLPWAWRTDMITGENVFRLDADQVGINGDKLEFRPYANGTLYVTYFDYDPDVYAKIGDMIVKGKR